MGILDRFALDGKTALVTGAGRGIGRALALALADAGARIVVAELNTEAGTETEFENWRFVMSVNIDGMFLCTQAVGRAVLEDGRRGSVINLASMSGFIANRGRKNSAYCTSKGAVVMFTREAATEWSEHGIRINAIAPGYIKTEGARAVQDPEVAKSINEVTPVRRIGVPEDLQGAAVYLASDASDFMTGQTLITDGGYTLW